MDSVFQVRLLCAVSALALMSSPAVVSAQTALAQNVTDASSGAEVAVTGIVSPQQPVASAQILGLGQPVAGKLGAVTLDAVSGGKLAIVELGDKPVVSAPMVSAVQLAGDATAAKAEGTARVGALGSLTLGTESAEKAAIDSRVQATTTEADADRANVSRSASSAAMKDKTTLNSTSAKGQATTDLVTQGAKAAGASATSSPTVQG